jgi:hypothetical protein
MHDGGGVAGISPDGSEPPPHAPRCLRTLEDLLSVPDPTNPYPLADYPRHCVFLRPTITSGKVEVGEYTYYDASLDAGTFDFPQSLAGRDT